MTVHARAGGRPRDTSIDKRVVAAARELLVEGGFDDATLQAISERSGVHSSAIYRRWPSRIQIIEQVIAPDWYGFQVIPTGDLRRDLRRFIRKLTATLGDPAARAAAPGLMSHYQSQGSETAVRWLTIRVRAQFHDLVDAAPNGVVDPTLDVEDVFDLLLGGIMARTFVPAIAARQRPIERLVDMAERLLLAPTAPGRGPYTTARTVESDGQP